MSDITRPVLIGAAQLIGREDDPRRAPGPVDMLEQIAREAAEDSGAGPTALAAVDSLSLVDSVGWNAKNPPRLLADRLGLSPKHLIASRVGGEMALALVNDAAERIMAGTARVALVAGTHNLRTGRSARRLGLDLGWPDGGEGEPEWMGSQRPGVSEREGLYGMIAPTIIYPIIENALRARRGLSPEEHRRSLGELMAPLTRVAATNPYAWFPVERDAEQLVAVSDENRMIAHPYTKFLNAVLFTDQAAGVLLTSESVADELGVPKERRVHWWGGARTIERAWFVSERPSIGDAPALRECARRTSQHAGIGIDEIGHIDFYSCFPIAVEMACEAYGVAEDDPRGLTISGGLPYAGGPGNNYTLHALVDLAGRLRDRPGDKGLVTGNGWYLTKHSSSVWSGEPKPGAPPTSVSREDTEAGPDPVEIADVAEGAAEVESYTVVYDRDGRPFRGIVLGRLRGDGRRFISGLPDDAALLERFVEKEAVGVPGRVSHVDGRNLFEPS